MKYRSRLGLNTLLCLIGLSCAVAGATVRAEPLPNFVLILLDDVGAAWLPPYADRLATGDLDPEINEAYGKWQGGAPDLEKHIDAARRCMPTVSALAKEGVVFDRCFATSSLCAPSRAGLLTGTFQQRWGVYDNSDIEEETGLLPEFPCLAGSLQRAGYRCAMIGKWHVGRRDRAIVDEAWQATRSDEPPPGMPFIEYFWKVRPEAIKRGWFSSCRKADHPLQNGFDVYYGYNYHAAEYFQSNDLWRNYEKLPVPPPGEFLTESFMEESLGFIGRALADEQPFFLYYSPMSNHGPHARPPEKYIESFDTGIKLSDEWAGHLLAVDDGLAKIRQLLKERGQLENTVFVVASDNGQPVSIPPHNAPFKGGKGTGWLGGLRVPLIVAGGSVQRRGVVKSLVSLADILPTFLGMAGLNLPQNIDGKNLTPFLEKQVDSTSRRSLVSTGLHSTRWSHSFFGERNKADSKTCPLYGVVIRGDDVLMQLTATPDDLYTSFPQGRPAQGYLFDLKEDILQSRDVSTRYPEKVETMAVELNRWVKDAAPPKLNHEGQYDELLRLTE